MNAMVHTVHFIQQVILAIHFSNESMKKRYVLQKTENI